MPGSYSRPRAQFVQLLAQGPANYGRLLPKPFPRALFKLGARKSARRDRVVRYNDDSRQFGAGVFHCRDSLRREPVSALVVMNDHNQAHRVLVTGAAGFIGSHVVDRLLAEGREVWGLDNFDPFYARRVKESNLETALADPRFHLHEGDLRDHEVLNEVFGAGEFDGVVHLAARPGVKDSIEAAEEYYDSNVMGTLRLLETMREFRVPAFVFSSSHSVYGGFGKTGRLCEDDPGDFPLSPYASSKRAAELLCHTYWQLHGLRCYCLRLFTVYGPRQRPDLALHKLAHAMLAREPVPVYGGADIERDYTYVDDAVDAICRALYRVVEADSGFLILNVGTGATVSLGEVMDLLEQIIGKVTSVERRPSIPGDLTGACADVTRARSVLGYEPKVTLEEGLQRFAEWIVLQEQGITTKSKSASSETPAGRIAGQ